MITCDLCGRAKDCLQKEIDGKEYDICAECWDPLAQRLKGKGRKTRETIFLPPPSATKEREEQETKPLPGEPPKIWGKSGVTH
jgi:ribosome-binding protein aMBF1 (putative translation factor)